MLCRRLRCASPDCVVVGFSWTVSLDGAVSDGQKYATVTAVDAAGNESVRSNEVAFVFDGTAPAVAPNLSVQ